MNARQLSVLAREIAQFCGSVCHLAQVLHNENRDATPDELSPLTHHDSRVAIALTGADPNTHDEKESLVDSAGNLTDKGADALAKTIGD